jgi:hypothetical protein
VLHGSLFDKQRNVFVKAAYWLFVAMVIGMFIGMYGMVLKSRAI